MSQLWFVDGVWMNIEQVKERNKKKEETEEEIVKEEKKPEEEKVCFNRRKGAVHIEQDGCICRWNWHCDCYCYLSRCIARKTKTKRNQRFRAPTVFSAVRFLWVLNK